VRQITITEKPVVSGDTTPLTAAEKAPARPASPPPADEGCEPPAAAIDAERGGEQRRLAHQARRPAERAAEEAGVEQHTRDQADPDDGQQGGPARQRGGEACQPVGAACQAFGIHRPEIDQ
jgi:hypothetical protein